MPIRLYTIECYDAKGLISKRVHIKGANETDGLSEAKQQARGVRCAFFRVRVGERVIYNSRDEA
jgi:hypothetical protein